MDVTMLQRYFGGTVQADEFVVRLILQLSVVFGVVND